MSEDYASVGDPRRVSRDESAQGMTGIIEPATCENAGNWRSDPNRQDVSHTAVCQNRVFF